MEQQNPKPWRYTWETQSHSPNLRLFLFHSTTNPKTHCKSLHVITTLSNSHLLITWIDEQDKTVSLHVPIPKLLLDTDSVTNFKALDDHIEVKLVLLLPIDHPLVSDMGLVGNRVKSCPLVMGYDIKSLESMSGVYFSCRKCLTRLTKNALYVFEEMPSVSWRESADNWFGNCCCSFGGISEKMVAKYTDSYSCSSGVCLLSATTVLLSKDDLVECSLFGESICSVRKVLMDECCLHDSVDANERLQLDQQQLTHEKKFLLDGFVGSACGQVDDLMCKATMDECCVRDTVGANESFRVEQQELTVDKKFLVDGFVGSACGQVDDSVCKVLMDECCVNDTVDANKGFRVEEKKLTLDKKFLLDGFLEDVFMAKASNVSKNVEWIEFVCSECSSPLGAYPSSGDKKPIDGGVRLFKCCISTSSVNGESSDVFREYTLERMFTNQLAECAKEELSFHVLVKDLTTKSPMFQIVILNPNSWSSTGLCSSGDDEAGSTLELSRVVKVLFSDCNSSVVKKMDEEVYILKGQGEELIELLTNASKFLPSSCSLLQGSLVSSMHL